MVVNSIIKTKLFSLISFHKPEKTETALKLTVDDYIEIPFKTPQIWKKQAIQYAFVSIEFSSLSVLSGPQAEVSTSTSWSATHVKKTKKKQNTFTMCLSRA